jgi:hypothetical protein
MAFSMIESLNETHSLYTPYVRVMKDHSLFDDSSLLKSTGPALLLKINLSYLFICNLCPECLFRTSKRFPYYLSDTASFTVKIKPDLKEPDRSSYRLNFRLSFCVYIIPYLFVNVNTFFRKNHIFLLKMIFLKCT